MALVRDHDIRELMMNLFAIKTAEAANYEND
jgi:hypothetical protein